MILGSTRKFKELTPIISKASICSVTLIVPISEAISDSWVEGPTITKIGNKWVVYFDRYRDHTFGAITSDDLLRWQSSSDAISFPEGIRHGTVFTVSNDVISKLKNHSNP